LTLGNAIRYIKWEIAQVPHDMADDEAKEYLYERIDHFIRDRIVFAGKVIKTNTIAKIQDGDVVLTFAR
jgi:translation initiation factor eIF-2B subunit delta